MSKIVDIGKRQHIKEEQRRDGRTKAVKDAFGRARLPDSELPGTEDKSAAGKLVSMRKLLKIYRKKSPSKG